MRPHGRILERTRGTAGGLQSLLWVDDGRVGLARTRTTRGELIGTAAIKLLSRRVAVATVVVPWRPAQRANFSDVLSAVRQVGGGSESLGSDATLVEEGAVARTEEQERTKALDASTVNLENARGGKPDVAIDEV